MHDITSPSSIRQIIKHIDSHGMQVCGATELQNQIVFVDNHENSSDLEKRILSLHGFSKGFLNAITLKSHLFSEGSKFGQIYDIEHYADIPQMIRETVKRVSQDDSVYSRRFVISFPDAHCFQCVQFLVRPGGMTTTVTMRSCDAVNNLQFDILVSAIMTDIFVEMLRYEYGFETELKHTYNRKIIMNIGSLHFYEGVR